MSDGLKAIAAAIAVASASSLIAVPADLFIDGERSAHEFVRGHYRQYQTLPSVTTVQQETGVRLPQAPEPLAYYIDRLYERHQYNLIRERFAGLRDGLSSMDMPAVSASVSDMYRVTRQNTRRGREVVNLREGYELMAQRLTMTRGYGGITGIEVGWPGYDAITGGYQPGDLISVVGRPSQGKTYVLLQQAWYAHQMAGKTVLFVTTEMSTEQIVRRHASLALGVNPTLLRMNMISTHLQRRLQQFYHAMAGADGFNIFSVGMNSQTSAVEALMQELDPDIVFVDGGYLMRPVTGAKNMNRTERITGVYDDFRGITLESEKPMIVSTQFNRAAGKGGMEGSLENIGYTDAIGTHSSSVVAIRPGPTVNPKASRWLDFLKGREGETGKIAINFKFAPTDMSEFTPVGGDAESEATAPTNANVDWME